MILGSLLSKMTECRGGGPCAGVRYIHLEAVPPYSTKYEESRIKTWDWLTLDKSPSSL